MSDHEYLTLTVRVERVETGATPMLIFSKALRRPGAQTKLHMQRAPITSQDVYERLSRLMPGAEVEIGLVTDWGAPDLPTQVVALHDAPGQFETLIANHRPDSPTLPISPTPGAIA